MEDINIINFNLEVYFKKCVFNTSNRYIAYLGDIRSKNSNTLTYALNSHYFDIADKNPAISTIIISEDIAKVHKHTKKNIIIETSPKVAFWKLHNYLVYHELMELPMKYYIHESAKIDPSALVSKQVSIGKNVQIDAGAVILKNTILEDNVHIHANAIIGSDGMQVIKDDNGNQIFIKHSGGVHIHKNVNVLASANISKAVDLTLTEVGENSVISLLASVGHNVKIGKNCMLAGNVLVGGSTIIEDNVWVGPSATIKDGLIIQKNAKIKLGSVVVKNVKEDQEVSGNFAYEHNKHIKTFLKAQR